jgi:hypothetical protein
MSSAPAAANVESFIPLNGSAGNSAPVTGGRRGSKKHLKLVTRKQARKLLKKLGKKMRGGQADAPAAVVEEKEATTAGRRHKKTRRHSKRSLFGLKY